MNVLNAFIIDIKSSLDTTEKKKFKRIMFLRNHVPLLYLVVYSQNYDALLAPLMVEKTEIQHLL